MTERIIEIEAESLEEARELVKSQIPEGLCLLSEKVISDGKPKTVKAFADTSKAAFAKAQSELPANASVLEKKELVAPEQKVITTEAFDEQSAKAQVGNQIGNSAIIKALKLTTSGKQGFLGIGKKPNQYNAEIFQQAVVEITYKTKAKISAEIGKEKIYDGPPISDLTQADLIRELQRMGMSDAELKVKMAITVASVFDRQQISAIHLSDKPLTLEDLPLRWAVHCIYHGARPIIR
jgi:hypothetical protein